MAKRENQICITLSKEGLQAVEWLKKQSISISKYVSRLIVNDTKKREVKNVQNK